MIEVMIAVAIVAFIIVIIAGTLQRQGAAMSRVERLTERENTARAAMNRMSREISMAYLSKHYSCVDRRTQTLFKLKEGASDGLVFTSFSHMKWVQDADESDQNEVSYYVKSDPTASGKLALFRREGRRITESPGKSGKEQILAHDISQLKFEFYNAATDLWEKSWDTTRSEHHFKLPTYVKITLILPWTGDKPRQFVTQARIVLQDALAFGPNTCTN